LTNAHGEHLTTIQGIGVEALEWNHSIHIHTLIVRA